MGYNKDRSISSSKETQYDRYDMRRMGRGVCVYEEQKWIKRMGYGERDVYVNFGWIQGNNRERKNLVFT